MKRTTLLRFAWVGFLALLLLHLDFWRPKRAVLLFDWIPEELAYRLLWMAGAFLFMLFLCHRIWREEA